MIDYDEVISTQCQVVVGQSDDDKSKVLDVRYIKVP